MSSTSMVAFHFCCVSQNKIRVPLTLRNQAYYYIYSIYIYIYLLYSIYSRRIIILLRDYKGCFSASSSINHILSHVSKSLHVQITLKTVMKCFYIASPLALVINKCSICHNKVDLPLKLQVYPSPVFVSDGLLHGTLSHPSFLNQAADSFQ